MPSAEFNWQVANCGKNQSTACFDCQPKRAHRDVTSPEEYFTFKATLKKL